MRFHAKHVAKHIGETGRAFGTRKKEHQKECEKETSRTLTRAVRQQATQENLKSAISDHCKRENHLMDWDGAKIVHRESNRFHRWIREAVEIRKRGQKTVNRDEGQYQLSHTWDTVLQRRPMTDGRAPDAVGPRPRNQAGGRRGSTTVPSGGSVTA